MRPESFEFESFENSNFYVRNILISIISSLLKRFKFESFGYGITSIRERQVSNVETSRAILNLIGFQCENWWGEKPKDKNLEINLAMSKSYFDWTLV